MDKHPNYNLGEPMPEYPEEKPYKNPWDDDSHQETVQDAGGVDIATSAPKMISSPVSEPKKAILEKLGKKVSEVTKGSKLLANNTSSEGIIRSRSAERKKRWREKHGADARRKEREYLKSWRAKKNGQA